VVAGRSKSGGSLKKMVNYFIDETGDQISSDRLCSISNKN